MVKKILPFSSLLIISVLLILVFKSFIFPNLAQSVKAQVKAAYTAQNVPELSEILNGDQNVRLNATRRLTERVGVEEALEILEHSSLPNTGEGHLAVHQVGFYAYRKHGLEAILKCKDYFLYACYHGAIIEASGDQGFEVIAKMADTCKPSNSRHFQCAHAAGHAIVAIWNYDLPNSLKTCDEVFENDKDFPQALSSCHNGAFMENLYGVHDFGTTNEPVRDWLSDDMFFPCNEFSEKYQKGCWLNQAARIYEMYGGDIFKTARTCEKIGNHQYVIWCIDSLSRQIHPLTNGETSKVFEFCQILGNYWVDACIITNAGSFYSVGGRREAIDVCSKIITPAKQACYQNIIGQVADDYLNLSQKISICREMEDKFEKECLNQI